jgi:hypothetical protein
MYQEEEEEEGKKELITLLCPPCFKSPEWCLLNVLPFKSWSSGLWRRVVLWYDTKVSEVYSEDGGCMDLRNIGILPHHYTASQPRRPRLELSRCESLKTRICFLCLWTYIKVSKVLNFQNSVGVSSNRKVFRVLVSSKDTFTASSVGALMLGNF